MKVGMLVKTSDWRYITLYPDEETALTMMFAPPGMPAAHRRGGRSIPAYTLTENIPLLILRMGEDPRLMEVLAGDKKGWMVKYPTMIFRRVK